MNEPRYHPCSTCGEDSIVDVETYPDAKGVTLCTNCWEVEGRLRQYLRSKRGWQFVLNELIESKIAERLRRGLRTPPE